MTVDMTARALWIPLEVDDLDAATRFYTDHLRLSLVDSWDREGEHGVVLKAADGAFIELVSPGVGHQPLIAFELANQSEVDNTYAEWNAGTPGEVAPPYRHPRGHYGFTVPGPAGVNVMVWSEG